MRYRKLLSAFFTIAILMIGCGALPDLNPQSSSNESTETTGNTTTNTSTAPTTPTCPSGDMDCFLDKLVLVNEDGSTQALVSIAQSLPPAGSATTMTKQAPSITKYPGTMTITTPSAVYSMVFTWQDPLGAQPAFCMYPCPKNVRCTASRVRCQRSKNDGLVSGIWRTWIGYSVAPALPAGSTESLDLNVIPLSAPAGADPIGILEDKINKGENIANLPTSTVAVGNPVTIPQNIPAPQPATTNTGGSGGGDSDSGSGKAGTSCTASSQCAGDCFSTRNCIPSVLNKTCECAGTNTPGSCQNSTCQNANGNCGDGTHGCCVGLTCVNGTCESSTGGRCPL